MNNLKRFFISALAVAMTIPAAALAKDYKASLAQMPVYAESADKGVLVDFTKALAKTSGSSIKIEVAPFARSMDNVIQNKVDFHMPLIQVPNQDESKLKYDHSTATIFHVNFVLYSNKNKPLDMAKLGGYKLETDAAHVGYFPFAVTASPAIDASLKRVDAGRIDGFIFADFASDPIVKAEKLSNIKRSLYKVFDVKVILPKGGKGGDTDKFLSATIETMKKDGSFDKIMSAIDQKYNDWQP